MTSGTASLVPNLTPQAKYSYARQPRHIFLQQHAPEDMAQYSCSTSQAKSAGICFASPFSLLEQHVQNTDRVVLFRGVDELTAF